jgi:hypothetical protein
MNTRGCHRPAAGACVPDGQTRVTPRTLGASFHDGSMPHPPSLAARAMAGKHRPGGAHVRSAFALTRYGGQRSHLHSVKQPADKRRRPGNLRHPGRRPSCPPRKQSRRVKRRKALVRNAAPVGHLTVRPVPSSEGTAGQLRRPARLAALHRGDFREASPHTLGPRFPLRATARSPGGLAGTLHTGRIARRDDTRGAPRARLIRPDAQAPLPAPPTESPR